MATFWDNLSNGRGAVSGYFISSYQSGLYSDTRYDDWVNFNGPTFDERNTGDLGYTEVTNGPPDGQPQFGLTNPRRRTKYLIGFFSGLNVPASAQIDGIRIDVRGNVQHSGIVVYDGRLVKNLSYVGVPQLGSGFVVDPDALNFFSDVQFGSGNYLWGTTWQPSDVRTASGLGFAIAFSGVNGLASDSYAAGVDAVLATVYYSQPTNLYCYTRGSGLSRELGVDCYTAGKGAIADLINATTSGMYRQQAALDCYTAGPTARSGNVPAFAVGNLSLTGTVDCFTQAVGTASGFVNCYQLSDIHNTLLCYTKGLSYSATGAVPAVSWGFSPSVAGASEVRGSLSAYLLSTRAPASGTLLGFLRGPTSGTSQQTLLTYTRGTVNVASNAIPAFVRNTGVASGLPCYTYSAPTLGVYDWDSAPSDGALELGASLLCVTGRGAVASLPAFIRVVEGVPSGIVDCVVSCATTVETGIHCSLPRVLGLDSGSVPAYAHGF